MAMLTTYFDASGSNAGDRAAVVAGFISSVNDWLQFEAEWKQQLQNFGVPYLHMREFAHSCGPFKKWKNEESIRREFLSGCMDLIESHTYRSFVTVIDKKDFNATARQSPLKKWVGNAYSFAARSCLGEIREWRIENHFTKTPVEYVFEAGDRGRGLLMQMMQRDGYPLPVFKPKLDKTHPERNVLPLQAADLLAYEVFKNYKDLETGRKRETFKRLEKTAARWGIFTAQNMSELMAAWLLAEELSDRLDRRS